MNRLPTELSIEDNYDCVWELFFFFFLIFISMNEILRPPFFIIGRNEYFSSDHWTILFLAFVLLMFFCSFFSIALSYASESKNGFSDASAFILCIPHSSAAIVISYGIVVSRSLSAESIFPSLVCYFVWFSLLFFSFFSGT